MRTHRTTGTGRGRVRALGGLVAAMLAVGVTALPALPAHAWTCKVNAAQNPSESQIQTILDGGPSVVTFYGSCTGDFEITRNLTVLGSGVATVVAGDMRAFSVDDGAIVTFRNLRITGGAADGVDEDSEGGGIAVDDGSVTLDRVTVFGNAAYNGGGVHVDEEGSLTVTASTFRANSADLGAAIDADSAMVRITGSTFLSNAAEFEGGAVRIDHSWAGCSEAPGTVIERSTFTGNTAIIGGGVWSDSADVTVTGSTFTRNIAEQYGGAFAAFDDCEEEPVLAITSSSFTSNLAWEGDFAPPQGGGVWVTSLGSLAVTNSRFQSNRSYGGGAIAAIGDPDFGGPEEFCDDTEVTITGSTFTSNRADWTGGAVMIRDSFGYDDILHSFVRSTFTTNTAPDGGALAVIDAAFEVNGSSFTRNTATTVEGAHIMGGGAILFADIYGLAYLEDSYDDETEETTVVPEYAIVGSRFVSNSSESIGGAVAGVGYSGEGIGQFEIAGSTFTGNRAKVAGGAVQIQTAATDISASTFTGNVSAYEGGALSLDNFADDFDPGSITVAGPGEWQYAGWVATDDATVFSGNRAREGGAISIYDGDLYLSGSVLGNTATSYGGGISFTTGDLECAYVEMVVTDARIERNTSNAFGGGIFFGAGCESDLIITTEPVSEPWMPDSWGEGGPVSISYNQVTGRLAGVGGGIFIVEVDEFLILTPDPADRLGAITIQRNSAVSCGGGVYVGGEYDATYLDDHVLIAYNTLGGFYDDSFSPTGPWDETYTGNVGHGYAVGAGECFGID